MEQNQNAPLIRELVDRIVALYDPSRIILFGSQAKGTNVLASDVDLLIVKDTTLPRSQRGLEVRALAYEYAVPIDLLFFTPEEVEAGIRQEYSFVHSAMTSGVEVYRKD